MPKIADFYAELGLKKDKYDKGMKDAEKAPSKLGASFAKAGPMIAGAFVVAAAGAVAFAKQAMEAWDVQAKAEASLLLALKGRKDFTDALIQQAGKLQKQTLFGDETTMGAQKMLAVMGLSVTQIKDLIPLLQDFSTVTGMDLAQAANLAGKAIATGTNALGRYGVELDATMSKTEKANELMRVFTERYGGQAKAAADVGTSGLVQLKNAWGDIMELIGAKIGPFMGALSKLLANKMSEATANNATGIQRTINDYVDADKEGRERIVKGLEFTLGEMHEKWMNAKDRQKEEDIIYYGSQWDIVKETLEKIVELNKQGNAQILDDTAKTTEAIKELWMDVIGVQEYQYSVGSALTPKGMPQVQSMGLASDTTGMGPFEFDYEGLDTAIQATENFISDMNSAMDQFTSDFVSGFAEGLAGLMTGDIGLNQFFSGILGMFGEFISKMGKMLIAYGIGMEAFKKAFTNPLAAIAAGFALVLIGGMISNLAARGPSGGGSTAGMSGGGNGTVGGYNYGGNQGGALVAEVSGDSLRFILERNVRNYGRIR